MNKLLKSLLLGMAAGILDVIPMVFLDLSWQANASAFLHWLALGVIITYAKLPMSGWLSGLILALITGIPVAVQVTESDPSAAIPIMISSVILGSLLGFMAEKMITGQPRQ